MAVFRYALLDLVRGRRRTFSAILGIVLAVTFLSGTFIAIDSAARGTLEGLLEGVPGDFTVVARSGDSNGLRQTLEAQPDVDYVSVYSSRYFDVRPAEGPRENLGLRGTQLLLADPAHLPRSLLDTDVMGSLDLPRGTIALTEALATDLRVGLGGRVILWSLAGYNPVLEQSIIRTLPLTVTALLAPPPTSIAAEYFDVDVLSLVHIRDVDWFKERLGPSSEGLPGVSFDLPLEAEVWIDRDQFLDPYDIEGSKRALTRFERDLRQAVGPYSASVSDNVSNALTIYEGQSATQRLVFPMLSLPVLLLGLYLGAVGVDLGHAERRRELAVLKARGAGGGQVFGLLLVGAALTGLLATFIGLLAGVALSRLLLTVVNPFALETAPVYGDVVLSAGTVIVLVAFSVGFMLLASYRSARRTARLPLAQTLRHYAPGETTIVYRPMTDIILVGLGAVSLLGVAYIARNPGTFFGFFYGLTFAILLPFAPIFLIVGATRILTRSTGRIYAWAARLWKPLTGSLHHVIHRNLRRNPRRASNVAVIIALGLGFGMFIFALLGSIVADQASTVRADIGADMSIRSPPAGDAGFAANVSALPSVAGVTRVRDVFVDVDVFSQGVPAFAVEPDTHFAVTQPEFWYFDGLSAEAAASLLRGSGNILASRALADERFLEVGDRLSLSGVFYDDTAQAQETVVVNVTVAGVARALPGTVFGNFLPEALYASFETLEPFFTTMDELVPPELQGDPAQLLVDLQPAASWTDVKSAIVALGAGDVRVYEEDLQGIQTDPVIRSFLGFITMEVAFMGAILTVGLGLVLFAATLERDVEFAAIRARGASGWQAAGILTGEAFSILLIGLGIGVGIGILVAYFFFSQVFLPTAVPQEPLVPYLFHVPAEGFLLVGLAPLAMLLTALLIASRVARMNTARVLKLRGG